MNAPDTALLPDVQASQDARNTVINRVGIKSLRYPVVIESGGRSTSTVATLDMYVALQGDRKGTHMSRFIEVLREHSGAIGADTLPQLLAEMVRHLDADEGSIDMRFPYFVNKAAPVTGVEGLLDYDVSLSGTWRNGAAEVRQKVVVPVTSLCPCSKKVSNYGAHNQRSHVTIDAFLAQAITLDEQIRIAEDGASCALWSVLKRPDEKYVTERAYDNPKFVEDTVRDIAGVLDRDARVIAFRVESENFESIHNHSAYALIERDKRQTAQR
jgi:GTP cyclohydrolase I